MEAMLNVGGKPSALASVLARAVGAASPTVSFEIVHAWSDQGKFERGSPIDAMSSSSSTDESAVTREMLCFEVPGARFSIRTWSSREPHAVPGKISSEPTDLDPSDVQAHCDVPVHSGHYSGSVALNPNFLYDSARSTEMLLTLDREAWKPDYADTLMVARVINKVALAVAESANSPIIFLQSPVSPYCDFTLLDCSDEKPRPARALAIRLAIGVDESSAVQRLKIFADTAALAADFGMGLQVADRRLGRVRGEWWTVSEPKRNVYKGLKSRLFDGRTEDVPASGWLLTFVGPARVGSLVAIMRDLFPQKEDLFSQKDSGILAIAVSTLQEIAFISVVVAVSPTDAGKSGVAPGGRVDHLSEELRRIGRDDGTTPLRDGLNRVHLQSSALSDYRLYSSGPVSLSAVNTAEDPEWSLWVSWELEPILESDSEVVRLLLVHLKDDDMEIKGCRCVDAGMEYYRARLLDNGRVKGRAKIYVRLSGIEERDLSHFLGELCVRVQTKTTSDLIKKGLRRDTFHIKLAWREMWLGSSPDVV
ncbi:MAG: hypothetical protein ACRDTC_07770 [Pseudonocardiaceae bacterium]